MASKIEYEMEPGTESIVQRSGRGTERAEELGESIGHTIDSAAQTIQNTLRLTKETARAAMGTVAEGIDTSTEYLADRGMEGVITDLEKLIRRYPFPVLLLGVSMGYLLSRSRER